MRLIAPATVHRLEHMFGSSNVAVCSMVSASTNCRRSVIFTLSEWKSPAIDNRTRSETLDMSTISVVSSQCPRELPIQHHVQSNPSRV